MLTVTLDLQEANPYDLLELDYYKGEEKQKVFKLKFGIPYWLKDSKGNIEPNNYITTQATDLKELGSFFKQKRIFIIKPK